MGNSSRSFISLTHLPSRTSFSAQQAAQRPVRRCSSRVSGTCTVVPHGARRVEGLPLRCGMKLKQSVASIRRCASPGAGRLYPNAAALVYSRNSANFMGSRNLKPNWTIYPQGVKRFSPACSTVQYVTTVAWTTRWYVCYFLAGGSVWRAVHKHPSNCASNARLCG